ncbi:histone H3 [Babesia caballi]|uniref:Histone H3 n=1 Tax=Babesia caballi TaxID=5871 RepID=A0AAV4LV10_BABCB|nr:histone H3 [Babesia caballi]
MALGDSPYGYSTPDEGVDSGDDFRGSRIPDLGTPSAQFVDPEIVEVSSSSREESVHEISDDSEAKGTDTPSPRPPSVTHSAHSSSTPSDDFGGSPDGALATAPEAISVARRSRLLDSVTSISSSTGAANARASFSGLTSLPRETLAPVAEVAPLDRFPRVSVVDRPIDIGGIGRGGSTSSGRHGMGGSTSSNVGRNTAAPGSSSATSAARSGANVADAVAAELLAEARAAPVPKRAPIKPVAVLSPARIIAEFKRGAMSKQQAVESLIRYRMNKMLHKNSDRMYVDKDGDVRFVKGYDFGKSRDPRGRVIRRNGLTRIEREILAYQKSTHLLIPRAVFARIVREIAQTWWRGSEPVKFTVEALSALQAATEDEITRLLEISTACSYHAKRITLRIDDMRLARFCRGRQEYEFFNLRS